MVRDAREVLRVVAEAQATYLEMMAAAFLAETKLTAAECVLCVETRGFVVRFWFEKKKPD